MMDKTIYSKFSDRYGFHADLSISADMTKRFLAEMERGFHGSQPECDLAMIPLILKGKRPEQAGKSVIVIDVGGTNTRASLISFDEQGNASIDEFYKEPTPGTGVSEEISNDAFFEGVARIAAPVLDKADHIGICFSFANRILPDGDAEIAAGGKQIMVQGFIGSIIGRSLRAAMARLGLPNDHRIRIINDTAAVLLGGMAFDAAGAYGDYVGVVLGTGLNQAYIEPVSGFLASCPEEADRVGDEATIVVNQECGGFRGIPLTDLDREYIDLTYDADIDWIEKLVSGRYLGGVVLYALKQAARDGGLISEGLGARALAANALDTADVSAFISSEGREGALAEMLGAGTAETDACGAKAFESNRLFTMGVIDRILDRTVFYVAICIAGALIRGERAEGKPACIMVEGSLYEKLPGFKEKLADVLDDYLDELCRVGMIAAKPAYRFTTGENTTLMGTALAGLWE